MIAILVLFACGTDAPSAPVADVPLPAEKLAKVLSKLSRDQFEALAQHVDPAAPIHAYFLGPEGMGGINNIFITDVNAGSVVFRNGQSRVNAPDLPGTKGEPQGGEEGYCLRGAPFPFAASGRSVSWRIQPFDDVRPTSTWAADCPATSTLPSVKSLKFKVERCGYATYPACPEAEPTPVATAPPTDLLAPGTYEVTSDYTRVAGASGAVTFQTSVARVHVRVPTETIDNPAMSRVETWCYDADFFWPQHLQASGADSIREASMNVVMFNATAPSSVATADEDCKINDGDTDVGTSQFDHAVRYHLRSHDLADPDHNDAGLAPPGHHLPLPP